MNRDIKKESAVKGWLHSQPWHQQWFDNLCKTHPGEDDYDIVYQFNEGRCGEYSLVHAFDFSKTPEGGCFWRARQRDFEDFLQTI